MLRSGVTGLFRIHADTSRADMKFNLLCSGSKGNCFVLESSDQCLVIDCGSTKRYLTQSFHNVNVDYLSVDAVLLTHDHSDHIAQLKMFANRNIYAPFEVKGVSESMRVIPYKPFHIGAIEITPIPLSHDTDINVGYVINDGYEKLVYITDTGYIKEHDFELIRGADYYIMESNHDPQLLMKTNRPYYLKQRILSATGHMSNEDSAEVLKSVITERTREIILAHVSEEANQPDLITKVMAEALSPASDTLLIKVAKQFEIVSGGSQQ